MKKCVYCLKELDSLTTDHVFPKSWRLGEISSTYQNLTVPSCKKCNGDFGRIEDNLRTRLVICLKDDLSGVKDLKKSVRRSLGIGSTKKGKEAIIRQKKLKNLQKELISLVDLSESEILFNFGPEDNWFEPFDAIKISKVELRKLGEKFVRGIHYKQTQNYIENDYSIQCYFKEEDHELIRSNIDIQKLEQLNIAPGFKGCVGYSREDENQGVFYFEIWEKLKIFGLLFRP